MKLFEIVKCIPEPFIAKQFLLFMFMDFLNFLDCLLLPTDLQCHRSDANFPNENNLGENENKKRHRIGGIAAKKKDEY